MKSTEYVLITNILTDVSIMCNTSMDRDLITIKNRYKAEGLSFFTITLPAFAKGFERSLELGRIDPSLFPAFAKRKTAFKTAGRGGLIPKFLSGITSMVFAWDDGTLRPDASIEAIDAVRQICLTFNKLKKECTDARKRNAIKAYLQVEEDLSQVRLATWCHRDSFRDIARICFGSVLSDVQENLYAGSLVPRHGPGAVVEKLSGNAKFRHRVWTRRLDRAMPADNYLFSNSEAWLSEHESLTFLNLKDEPPVKVIFVPKTAKTPRVIAIEPTSMQYTQQAFMSALVEGIESDPLVGRSIHFTDNSINRSLAKQSSRDRSMATLDLSEASDRVHAALVVDLLGCKPDLMRAIFACRSSTAKLPNGQILTLKKFASMGSALCFPIESMVFFTLCVLAGLRVAGRPVTKPAIEAVAAKITVFGDDLIVPAPWSEMCINILESVGLRVNRSKSFSKGNFRESCGMDAYKGHQVTPVYIRQSMPTTRRDTEGLLATVASADLFYRKGYWETARFMRGFIEGLYGFLPHVADDSSVVGWKSFQQYYSVERWNRELSKFEIFGLTVKSRTRKDVLEGYDRLLRFHLEKARTNRSWAITRYWVGNSSKFLKRKAHFLNIMADTSDPEKSTLRGSAYTKRRWTSPH
jgi:hypothetical protein